MFELRVWRQFVTLAEGLHFGHAAARLQPAARRLLALADDLPRVAQAADAGLAGRLRLAFVSSIAYWPLLQ